MPVFGCVKRLGLFWKVSRCKNNKWENGTGCRIQRSVIWERDGTGRRKLEDRRHATQNVRVVCVSEGGRIRAIIRP